MSDRFYLAARYSRRLELCGYRSQLASIGLQCTARWLHGEHEAKMHGEGSEKAAREDRVRYATEDLQDVAKANWLISFTEEPRIQFPGRGGRHVEFGFGLARGMHMVVIGAEENVFHTLPDVQFHHDWMGFFDTLIERQHRFQSAMLSPNPEAKP